MSGIIALAGTAASLTCQAVFGAGMNFIVGGIGGEEAIRVLKPSADTKYCALIGLTLVAAAAAHIPAIPLACKVGATAIAFFCTGSRQVHPEHSDTSDFEKAGMDASDWKEAGICAFGAFSGSMVTIIPTCLGYPGAGILAGSFIAHKIARALYDADWE